jgi:hypothetical protein
VSAPLSMVVCEWARRSIRGPRKICSRSAAAVLLSLAARSRILCCSSAGKGHKACKQRVHAISGRLSSWGGQQQHGYTAVHWMQQCVIRPLISQFKVGTCSAYCGYVPNAIADPSVTGMRGKTHHRRPGSVLERTTSFAYRRRRVHGSTDKQG